MRVETIYKRIDKATARIRRMERQRRAMIAKLFSLSGMSEIMRGEPRAGR